MSYIDLAQKEGGTILSGGKQVNPDGRCADGWFIEPTVIDGLAHDCRTNQEEIFGPVVTLMPFDTEDEVLGYANSVRYGLSAALWTETFPVPSRRSKTQPAFLGHCWMPATSATSAASKTAHGVVRRV